MKPNTGTQGNGARVIASYGRHYLIETDEGHRWMAHPRGKKMVAVVGDRVQWSASGDAAVIESVLPRRNCLLRRDAVRTKVFAANIDQILLLVAAEPDFSEEQLARVLIAAEAEQIPAVIAVNKRDLGPAHAKAMARLAPYPQMGYTLLGFSLQRPEAGELDSIRSLLTEKATLVLGPSGAGKSSLINRLVPHAQAETQEISQALNSGKHTTTRTTWYWLDRARNSAVIDSPGFQEFGLQHIEALALASLMPDLRRHIGHCRFHNCTHLHEPDCAVIAAVGAPGPEGIAPQRYRIYQTLFAECSKAREYARGGRPPDWQ